MINTNPEASRDFIPVFIGAMLVLIVICHRYVMRGTKDR